jgi:tRNA threonylcarbamoyladenosine biosynthesis protein TsaE
MVQYTTSSPAETHLLGKWLGSQLESDSILCFFGELGAGKTTLIRGITEGAAQYDSVSSPTFVYLNVYRGTRTIYHFDLYRLEGADEFISMGFDELFDAGGICCIEWSEKIAELLPDNCIRVEMEHAGEDKRVIRWI